MDKEKAKREAWKKIRHEYMDGAYELTIAYPAFSDGYDAGHSAAQGQWVKIEGPESLPNTHEVWITIEYPSWERPMVKRGQYDTVEGCWNQLLYHTYEPLFDGQKVTAWQEIASDPEPFTE